MTRFAGALTALKLVSIVILIKFSQWGATQLNATWCQQPGFWGFWMSFVTSESPLCQALTQVSVGSGMMYSAFFAVAVGEILRRLGGSKRCEVRKRKM